MKFAISVLLALCTAQLSYAASLVSVRVTNPTERTFRISYEEDAVTAKPRIFRVNLRDDNTASFELSLPQDTELQMTYGELTFPLYVGRNDSINITLDAQVGIASIAFEGTAQVNNTFLAAYAKTFPEGERQEIGAGFLPFMVERSVLAEAAIGDIDLFTKYLYAQLDARTNLINKIGTGVDKNLLEHYRLRNKYRAELNKAAFLIQNQQTLPQNELRSAAARLGLADPNIESDQALLDNQDFKEYLKAYAQYLALPNNGGHDERNGEEVYQAIQTNIDRPWRHYLQAELLVNAFDFLGNPEFGLDHYPAMKRDGVSEVYRNRIEQAYGEVLNLSPDSMAPNIGMYTQDGAPVSLTDLSGKVVYISFWASWCKPCLVNFKKYDAIRAQLADKGVTLLNISIDDDEFAWKRSLTEENPRGLNTRATNIDDVKRTYNLSSIPAYHIVDKAGKIVVLPGGGNRDLIAAFEEILAR